MSLDGGRLSLTQSQLYRIEGAFMRANRTVHFLAVYAPLLIAALLLSFVVVSDAAEPLARAQVGTQDHGDDNEWDVIQNFYDQD